MNHNVLLAYHARPKHTLRNIGIAIFLLVVFIGSWDVLQFNQVSETGMAIALNIIRAFVNPNWEILSHFEVDSIWSLMLETVGIAFLGTLLGALLSLPFAFLTAINMVGPWISWIGNVIITAIRTFPFFILALMFVRVTGPGPFTGVLTIAILSIGMIAKLMIEAIEDMNQGVLEALDSMGATRFQKIRFGVLPQLTAAFISIVLHRFEINVKNAAVLGIVGAGGIGFTLLSAMNAFRWQDTASALIGLIIVVILIEFLSTLLRKRIVEGK